MSTSTFVNPSWKGIDNVVRDSTSDFGNGILFNL